MATTNGSCPLPPYPGLDRGSAGHNFSLAVTIIFPLFLVLSLSVYFASRKKSVFLRKRSVKLLMLGGVLTFIPWSCTALYDYVGSENFPCGLFVFLVYVSNPSVSYPLVLKIAGYYNQVSLYRIGRELQEAKNASPEGKLVSVVLDPQNPLKGEISTRTTAAHIRVVCCKSRTKNDLVLNAKFSRTIGLSLIWFIFTSFPFFLAFFIRVAMNPHWTTCTGCELEVVDAAFLIAIATGALIACAIANPTFSKRGSRRDALRIVRECVWAWMIGGFFYNLSFVLFLLDPGSLYANRVFNWRFFMLFATGTLYYVQTIHQVLVSRRMQREVLFAPSLAQIERFEEVMGNKDLKRKLQIFLDGELSGEILKFLHAVEEYKRTYSSQESAKVLAKEIFKAHIMPGSKLEVNMSSNARTQLVHLAAVGQFEVDVFDEAYQEVKNEFLSDGFSRFLRRLEKHRSEKRVVVSSMSNSQHQRKPSFF